MLRSFHAWCALQPLAALTVIALVPRLIAAFFSEGYFAHDDHFLVIEAAASWVDGFDYNNWLPWNQTGTPHPSGHSFVYVGLHYVLFSGLKLIGLGSPKAIMLIVRSIHAIWSLVVVRAGYRIALRLASPEIAWRAGLFLALFYFMPFLAVRNLVEVACIPFLMLGAYRLVRSPEGPSLKDAFVAGLWIGLAVNIRFQTLFFAVGPGLAFLLQKRWKEAVVYGLGATLPIVLLQGSIDLFIWSAPFAELTEYVGYNLVNTTTYFDQPWYNYLLLLAGIYIPFLSVAVLFGIFRKTSPLLLWIPLMLFLAVHSYFPNKQERFLLPIVPLFFVVGYAAWEQWRSRSSWWQQHIGLWKGQMVFVVALNTILLVVLCGAFSKRSRVEAMDLLRTETPLRRLIMEDTVEGEPPLPPLFYLGQWNVSVLFVLDPKEPIPSVDPTQKRMDRPDGILFFGMEDLPQRMARVIATTGPLEVVAVARPGLVDRVVHWLNPVNRNEAILVTRTVAN
ncbi:MAG: glycosyltransferase family 39 protein [Flavobacteriales bacterium]|nr:glycosyltransferase family 39 protein [Flavobacteriales bacterium]